MVMKKDAKEGKEPLLECAHLFGCLGVDLFDAVVEVGVVLS